MALLGIDVGTGGTRALLLSAEGRILGSATAAHADFNCPQPAWAEQEPADWWRACQTAIRHVLAQTGTAGRDIAGIGLAGQMHGTVVLDEDGAVLRPAIIWCDQRGEAECRRLETAVGADRLLQLSCNPALTNFTLIKLLWLRHHEPQTWQRIRHLLLPKDYIRYRLSGEFAIDVAEASGTLMLDVAGRRWSPELVEASGLSSEILPRVFESPEVCARVSAEAAAATGLAAGTPIVAGAGDQAAGAVGMGICRPGAVSATIGTSGVVFAATARPVLDPQGRLHTFCHAVPGRWHVMGVTQAAGLSLRWFRNALLGGDAAGAPDYGVLDGEAGGVAPGAEGLLWAPYLMGERTPHCDPDVRGALLGLGAHHTRAHVTRAILEGVAFSLRDTFSIFEELGVPVEGVRVGGGGAHSPLWRQIQADVYGRAVETVEAEEGAALGAAMLAGVGSGTWAGVDDAAAAVVRPAARVECREDTRAVLDAHYGVYRRVYPALKSLTGAEAGAPA